MNISHQSVESAFDEFLLVYGRHTGTTTDYQLVLNEGCGGYQVKLQMPSGGQDSIFGMDWLTAEQMYYALRMSRQVAVQMNGFLREAISLRDDAQRQAGIRK